MVYQRNGRVGDTQQSSTQSSKMKNLQNDSSEFLNEDKAQKGIKINGFEQVLDLLKAADYEFRVSLLKRLHGKNPKLGESLYQELVLTGHIKT
jgi:hypothetical protein